MQRADRVEGEERPTASALEEFFATCDASQAGADTEPDWHEHEATIRRSQGSGLASAWA